jgi:hypothetical protein
MGLEVQRRDTGLVLTWSPNVEPDLVGYNIYLYSPSPERPESYVKYNDDLISISEFRQGKLKPNTEMIFRLTAIDQSGNESGYSSLILAATVPVQLKEQW